MSDVVNNIGLKPEFKEAIRARSMATGRKIADAVVRGVGAIVEGKTEDLAAEVETLKARLDRVERLLAPAAVPKDDHE